jgi:hypothetical protein
MVGVDVDDLYGLPLDRFVPERAAQVRALRAAGERKQAATVAALRKPSVAAWAVNQLVRTQRRELQALLDAGDALRSVQADVLAKRAAAHDLRSAAGQERTAVDGLVSTARGLLSSTGQELSATTLGRVADTLHAAALDDEAREQVMEGRLVRELRHVGLGGAFGLAPPTRSAPARFRTSGATADRESARARRAAEAAERREQERAHKEARANERDAAREVERAERSLRAAQERRDRAAEALAQADEALADAQAGREAARAAHRQARQQLESI